VLTKPVSDTFQKQVDYLSDGVKDLIGQFHFDSEHLNKQFFIITRAHSHNSRVLSLVDYLKLLSKVSTAADMVAREIFMQYNNKKLNPNVTKDQVKRYLSAAKEVASGKKSIDTLLGAIAKVNSKLSDLGIDKHLG
jgi:hypothetical protein